MIRPAVLVALALPLLLASSASAARPCTADDLRGSRTPADFGDINIESNKDALVVGTSYRVVVVQEYGIGDNARPVDGSTAVSAPNGPPLQATTENGRPAYDFTPAAAGTVRIVVTWDEDIGSSGDRCSASRAFDFTVLQPTLPTMKGTFSRGRGSNGSSFRFRLFGRAPQDPGTVTLILRARRGTTKPPPPRGRAIGRFNFKPDGDGGFQSSAHDRDLARSFSADVTTNGLFFYPYVNAPFGKPLKFAFSVEVVQNGKRLGGMRAGANCRRRQFTGHSAIKCRAAGLRQRP